MRDADADATECFDGSPLATRLRRVINNRPDASIRVGERIVLVHRHASVGWSRYRRVMRKDPEPPAAPAHRQASFMLARVIEFAAAGQCHMLCKWEVADWRTRWPWDGKPSTTRRQLYTTDLPSPATEYNLVDYGVTIRASPPTAPPNPDPSRSKSPTRLGHRTGRPFRSQVLGRHRA